MPRRLAFATTEPEIADELRPFLPHLQVDPLKIDVLPDGEIQECAKLLAAGAFFNTGNAALAIITDFHFDAIGPNLNKAGLEELREIGPAGFARKHSEKYGVLRVIFAFTPDGQSFVGDQRDVPGRVSGVPATNGSVLDRIWIPNGYQRSISELMAYQPQLNRRERAYRIVANLLGTDAAQDIYEAHVTVELPHGAGVSEFQQTCADIGVKAIHIELPSGNTPTHFITGSIHSGTLDKVAREVDALARQFDARGFTATRRKIEAMIQNRAVPLTDADGRARPASNYFEFHTKVTLVRDQPTEALERLCRAFGAHLARSASNRLAGDATQRFVTVRFHDEGRTTAEAIFGKLVEELRIAGYQPSHILKEYVVLDTNLDLDAGWADSAVPASCYTNCADMSSGQCVFLDGASVPGTHPELIRIGSR
ncbi:MAG: hypothetical protein JO061_07835 [Acidobacteriaceae bacterium]|nr:hypothetical protein [Acidobacteriaceae bacterium]